MTKQKESGISWTEETWNPTRGCSRVSKGCMNCYAEGVANRFKGPGMPYEGLIARTGQWNGEVRLIEDKLLEPILWRKPKLVFVNSMSDLFHESLTDEQIDKVFAVMAIAERHTFQVLTKRAERMAQYLSAEGLRERWARAAMHLGRLWVDPDPIYDSIAYATEKFLPNVWLGVSAEDQATADERIRYLLETPAAVRWVSAEPLLGPIDLRQAHITKKKLSSWPAPTRIDWCVVGGESGAGARPMHPDWARSLRDQCQEKGVAFHFKQWGEWKPSTPRRSVLGEVVEVEVVGECEFVKNPKHHKFAGGAISFRIGKKAAGRLLDGVLWDEYPEVYAQ